MDDESTPLVGEEKEQYDAGYADGKRNAPIVNRGSVYYKAGYADGMWERMSGEHSYDPTN